MNYLKMLGKSFLYIISILFFSVIIITILNYFNIFGNKLVTIFKIISALVSIFVGGFIVGKKAKEKGWLEGLKFGIIIITILFLINWIILKQELNIKNFIYYLILITSSILGGMIGISKKTVEEK